MFFSIFVIALITVNSGNFFNTTINSKTLLPQRHPDILQYDLNECSFSLIRDEENKAWFSLTQNNIQHHFPHSSSGVSTIKYFISETSLKDSSLTWNYNMPNSELGEEVKQNFLNSILKWNNVYFYEYSSQYLFKKKLVNITQGTSTDNNLIISPEKASYMFFSNSAAEAVQIGSPSYQVTQNSVSHRHYNNWHIALNLESAGINTTNNNAYLKRYGAHELGHVLGLKDIDTIEGCGSHHSELLMGYASPTQSNITYKDLVGAAITRGYHTDSDHSWMYDSSSSTSGHYKLICSICNGVKYVSSLTGYSYVNYKTCLDNHSLSSGNMFAVASYGNTDYYKCKYCRYVAPYEDNVIQNYSRTYYDSSYHLVTSQVTGLSYSFYEEHTLNSYDICTGCGHNFHNHTYLDHYATYDSENHKAYCSCGVYTLRPHAVDMDDLHIIHGQTYGNCIQCGELINLSNGGPVINPGPHNTDFMVTDNGSFILPNGIYMLVSEDIEAYLNGTLIFHPYGEVSE